MARRLTPLKNLVLYCCLWQVQMKEQILRGLLRLRDGDEDGDTRDGVGAARAAREVQAGAISRASDIPGNDTASRVDDNWERRKDLIKTGAVTPLDDLTGLPSGASTRARMTLMDHKIAEGMKVKLPRSRPLNARTRRDRRHEGDTCPASGTDPYDVGTGVNFLNRAPLRPGGKHVENAASPTFALAEGKDDEDLYPSDHNDDTVDDAIPEGSVGSEWTCPTCTLLCSAKAVECPSCGERRHPRRVKPPNAHYSNAKGANANTLKRGSVRSEARVSTAYTAVACPVCAQQVRVDDPADPDASLSTHMDRCTRRRRKSRSDRPTDDECGHEGRDARRSIP